VDTQHSPQNRWIRWPDKPGRYWFYGHTNEHFAIKNKDKPQLLPVVVQQASNGLVVHYYAEFLWESHAVGMFLPMEEPKIPDRLKEILDYSKKLTQE